jgi:ribulose-5-phosphate 4-epimerase/fuculose-1-phosphate aldolase
VSDLLLVGSAGQVVDGNGPVNLAGFAIHSSHAKAFSSLGIELAALTQDAAAFFGDHAVHREYGGPAAGYNDEGEKIARALGGTKAAILQNHGLLTVGHSVGEAAWWFITMERGCQAQLLAMAAGKPISVDRAAAEAVYAELGTHYAGWFSFRPLWDQITAEEPDLFD